MTDFLEFLKATSYPGRGILVGRRCVYYFIMGRSENSRNRVFVKTEDGIRTEAHDPAKLSDPSLIIYHPVRTMGRDLVVTNGDQTDTICEHGDFRRGLMTREYEPDEPNWTPRISAIMHEDGSFELSILKRKDGRCLREFFCYEGCDEGKGYFISTYQGDGNPLPTFAGEPLEVTVPKPEEVWAERIEALDLDVASDFLLVAATLLDIKAASLVPQEAPRKVDDDDDEFDEDLEELSTLDGDALREVLIQRLIAYKQFKGAAAALGARMQAESRMHPRVAGPDPEFLGLMPDYLAGITLRGLAVICADLDGKRQTFLLEAEHVAPHRVPLDLTVASVDRFTMAHQTCTFRELLDGDATTEQLVVTFLAMLELAKRGSLTLSQDEIFGTIRINRVEGAEAYVPGEGPELTE